MNFLTENIEISEHVPHTSTFFTPRFVGGYAYLDGGRSPWAWHVLTGDNVFSFKKGSLSDVWERYIYVFTGSPSKKGQKHQFVYAENWGERLSEACR